MAEAKTKVIPEPNTLSIKQKQVIIRDWSTNILLNPIFQALQADPDFDTTHIFRWIKMFGYVSIFANGGIISNEDKWREIESQLIYNPLALIDHWNQTSAAQVSKRFLTNFYIIQENLAYLKPKWIAAPSIIVSNKYNVTPEEYYKFLGFTGGLHRLDKYNINSEEEENQDS